jgi:hypothetical protein
MQFFVQNQRILESETLLMLRGWYSGCLRYIRPRAKNEYGFIDSSEELLLDNAMIMMHGKKWNGEGWVKSIQGYEQECHMK